MNLNTAGGFDIRMMECWPYNIFYYKFRGKNNFMLIRRGSDSYAKLDEMKKKNEIVNQNTKLLYKDKII